MKSRKRKKKLAVLETHDPPGCRDCLTFKMSDRLFLFVTINNKHETNMT